MEKAVVLPDYRKMPARVFDALMVRLELNARNAYRMGCEYMHGSLGSSERYAKSMHFFKLSKYYANAANVLRSRYFDSYVKG